LLTVISIIAILVSLIIPAIQTAKNMAHKGQAKSALGQIVTAVSAYHTDYGKYPLADKTPDPSSPTDVLFGDGTNSNHILFDVLRNIGPAPGAPNHYNPKGVSYWSTQYAADPNAPKGGIAPQAAGAIQQGCLVDPWGAEYRIAIDADEDGRITNLPYNDFQGPKAPTLPVAAFSLGRDAALGDRGNGTYRTDGNASDDVLSWQ
jgi:type II secretory pathway pseudopilin PulG